MIVNDEREFNRAAVAKLHQLGGSEFVRRMIDMFFDYAPKRLAAAQTALLAGDLPGVEKSVHPLKSSAGQLGAVRIQELAAQIEKMAMERRVEALPALLAELDASLAGIRPLLEQERKVYE